MMMDFTFTHDMFLGFFAQPQVRGIGWLATRHDCQRVGLA